MPQRDARRSRRRRGPAAGRRTGTRSRCRDGASRTRSASDAAVTSRSPEPHPPGRRPVEAAEEVEQRRLARPGAVRGAPRSSPAATSTDTAAQGVHGSFGPAPYVRVRSSHAQHERTRSLTAPPRARSSGAPSRGRSPARGGPGPCSDERGRGTPAGSWRRPTRSSTAYSSAWWRSTPCSSSRLLRQHLGRQAPVADLRRCAAPAERPLWSWVTISDGHAEPLVHVAQQRRTPAAELASSSSPVGSSAKSTSGALARATAMATRCCWPPDISRRQPVARRPRPRAGRGDRRPAAARRRRGDRATARAMATFSAPVRYGSRLREVCCQTKPAVCRRYVVRSLAVASRAGRGRRRWPSRRSARRARTGS